MADNLAALKQTRDISFSTGAWIGIPDRTDLNGHGDHGIGGSAR